MKFDLVTLYPMHRRCITLISSLLTPSESGWVRKPLNYLKVTVRTGMYQYILVRTNMEFLYCPVPSRTGTYWYVPVRTILPNPVQGYRIPDVAINLFWIVLFAIIGLNFHIIAIIELFRASGILYPWTGLGKMVRTSTYQYVPVRDGTGQYKNSILVRSSMYRFRTYRHSSRARPRLGPDFGPGEIDVLKQIQAFISMSWLPASSCPDSHSPTTQKSISAKSHLKK